MYYFKGTQEIAYYKGVREDIRSLLFRIHFF
jgi:hypothetical protein